jgi:hypothetical protein
MGLQFKINGVLSSVDKHSNLPRPVQVDLIGSERSREQ